MQKVNSACEQILHWNWWRECVKYNHQATKIYPGHRDIGTSDIGTLHWVVFLNSRKSSDVMWYLQGVNWSLQCGYTVEISIGTDDFVTIAVRTAEMSVTNDPPVSPVMHRINSSNKDDSNQSLSYF